jgi:glycerate 2-kinase
MTRLVAPTAFKGTMSPLEAARYLAREGDRLLPLSDGGDGFLECLHTGLGGEYQYLQAEDPFGRLRPVPVLLLPEGIVAVECARVIGLAGLDHPDPLRASSAGFGQLLSHFQDRKLWIGLGGSATVDGGATWPELRLPHARVFCDVATDLLDTARVFGPQKGARPEDIPILEARLRSLGLPRGPRTGAAGGLGARLQACGAELLDGAAAMLEVLDFEGRCSGVESVLTGEGRLDASTLEGKLPLVVARQARALGLRVLGHFGCRGPGWEEAAAAFDEVEFEVP